MSADPFDGGLIDASSGFGRGWFRPEHSDKGGLDHDVTALGVIAALANLGRIMPWTGTVREPEPEFRAERWAGETWIVLNRYGTDVLDVFVTEPQAHAIAAVLNGTTLPDEVRLTEAERAVLHIVASRFPVYSNTVVAVALRKERGLT